ncbi:MAG: PP2C family protein-serine/threonine phosphatase [Patescibacteria group bacterium]
MFALLKRLLGKKDAASEAVTDFTDAVEWINTYRKAGNYDTALMATHELLLKIKSGINWSEQAERKATVLESTNLEDVAKTANAKKRQLQARLDGLYKWERTISKLIDDLKHEKVTAEEKAAELHQLRRFADMENEVKAQLKKKDYVKALQAARALVGTFEGNPKAMKLLTKVQDISEKQKSKSERQAENQKRLQKFFEEVGAEIHDRQNAVDGVKVSLIQRMKAAYAEYGKGRRERAAYIKEQKSLKDIESLLLRAGGIVDMPEGSERLLEAVKSGTARAVSGFSLPGFDFFGEIRGKDQIVGDTFGSYTEGKRTVFYFGDATGHGVQAGFTVAALSKLFHEHVRKIKSFPELFVRINNDLKDRIKARMFVTAVFFEYDAERNTLQYIGAGHDKMIYLHYAEKTTELITPGNLALGVRVIKNVSSIKPKEIVMKHRDALFGYTDGFVEARNGVGSEFYGLERLEASFKDSVYKSECDPDKAYKMIYKNANDFAPTFDDDVSGFIWIRNTDKDVIVDKGELQAILDEVGLKERESFGGLKNRNRAEIMELLKKEKFERELKIRLIQLDRLYKMGEYLKLKQRIQDNFREGYVHDRMKKYLEKIIQNEDKFKMLKLEERLRRKYETLVELQKKGENEIVIREVVEIITR